MRKERPRILDRDGLTHEMDESTDTTRPHTCPKCGTTRSRNAVPYLVLDHAMAEYDVRGLRRPVRELDSGRCAQGRCGWPRRDCEANARTSVSGTDTSIDADASAPLSQAEKVRRRTLAGRSLA